ncbi:MAG: IRE (iron responsive element) [Planctomycetes bacterium]|nr:IRE (iron responsive element) [Planctomycetota bacterium]
MNWNAPFARKIVYGVLIVVLLIPLFRLGQPASYDANGEFKSAGMLANMRIEYDLAQANLGEIDPASESMKLATLGLRGVAASILWQKSNEYKKKEDWDNLSATLNQITKLQPNFIGVWEFQGHNLAYNVSVEFDNYRHRYHWVKKGIEFLIKGTEYNSKEARLFHNVGWFFGQKIGRADEHEQFRRLFREDADFHASLSPYVDMESSEARSRHDQLPDNWLVSRLWYIRAADIVDSGLKPLRGKSPLVFHSDRPKAYMNHAEAIETEGHFGEVARAAWADGLREWTAFGSREIPSTWGVLIRLNEYAATSEEIQNLTRELDTLAPTARADIAKERREALTAEEAELIQTPEAVRNERFTEKQWMAYQAIMSRLFVSDDDVVTRVPTEHRSSAERIARKLSSARLMIERIDRYRNQVAFAYWKTRCEVEQTERAAKAREHLYQADRDLENAKLEEAKKNFELAWDLWAALFAENPELKDDLAQSDLRRPFEFYRITLSQLGEDLPKDFKLPWLVEKFSVPEVMSQDYAPIEPQVIREDPAKGVNPK